MAVPPEQQPVAYPLMVAVALLAFISPPDRVLGGPVVCNFRRFTGLPCPGCGLTRSFAYAAHFRWRESLQFHPFGPAMFLAFIALPLTRLIGIVGGFDTEKLIRTRPVQIVLWLATAIWLAWSVARLAGQLRARFR